MGSTQRFRDALDRLNSSARRVQQGALKRFAEAADWARAASTRDHVLHKTALALHGWLRTRAGIAELSGKAKTALLRIADAAPLASACVTVAASNLLQRKLRLLAALSGMTVALFLLLLQISVLDAARAKVTALFDDFKFDMIVVPDTYQFLLSFDTMDRVVLEIAQATGDVADSFGLNVDVVHWTQLPSKRMTYNFLVGIDEPGSFVRDPDMRSGWERLQSPHAILADRYSQPAVGPVSPGTDADIGDQRVTVAGQFKLGLFFYAEGAALVRNANFPRLTGRDTRSISIGLIQLKPGVSAAKARLDLLKALPSHLLVMTRQELLDQERHYFLSTKPVGIMLFISMIIACLVGASIIVQVLSTEVGNRMNEYAVLKAMGADPRLVYGVGMMQAAMLGLGGLLPACALGALVLAFIDVRTHLGTSMNASLTMSMLLITLALSAICGAAIVRRVQHADPAALF